MIKVDFHVHSIFSNCGLHTVLEILSYAKKKGIKGLAITDHGPELGGRLNSVFFERFENPIKGIKLIKGIEANLTKNKGEIDFPISFMKYTDLILLGIHPNTEKGLGKKVYTDMLIEAIRKNPYVDVISHPNDLIYLVDFTALAEASKDMGIAIELNNSKLKLKRVDMKTTEELVDACLKTGCKMVLSSDAHVISELGRDEDLKPLIKKMQLPGDLFVNNNVKNAFRFINDRKSIKKKFE